MRFNDESIDSETPMKTVLSANYRRSYAYITIRDRLPVTITNIIDHLVRNKDLIVNTFGECAREELKEIIGSFSRLKNEVQTNKSFQILTSDGKDIPEWNRYQLKEIEKKGGEPQWFCTSWLYAECYMYRRIHEIFELSASMKTFDPFRTQKENALLSSIPAVIDLGNHVLHLLENRNLSQSEIKKEILRLVKVTLWGNQYDLSRPIGSELPQDSNPLENVELFHDFLLVDDSEHIWTTLSVVDKGNNVVDFINDNAGYEIFTDLCLADALCTFSLAEKVRFHVKALPWFISDTTHYDFFWVLKMLKELSDKSSSLPALVKRWEKYLRLGKWTVDAEHFWTLPVVYSEMKATDPDLYAKLSEATLVIFKGDLNYRKLLGEINWPYTERFSEVLQGFHPAPLVTLRTIKADLICGLQPGQAEVMATKNSDWMTTGDYAVIQFNE